MYLLAKSLLNYITYLPDFGDEDTEKFARSILFVFIVGIICATCMGIYYILYQWWSNVIIISVMLVISLYCLGLLRRGNLERSATIAAMTVICALISSITIDSGIYDPGILVLFPLLVILANFIEKKRLYILGGVIFTWIWGLYFLEQFGYYDAPGPKIEPLDLTILTSAIFIFSLALLQVSYQRMNSMNQKLLQLKEAAEEANLAKSNFLTVMSHELRTPLNAIIGYSEILIEDVEEENSLVEESLIDLKGIKKSGKQLLAIINDILDLSKIDAHKIELNISSFYIEDFIQDILEITAPAIEKNNNVCDVEWHLEAYQTRIDSDREKLGQILLNLLSNAAKFTYDGTITISVHESESDLFIDVKDTGIGIPPENLNRIFESFEQVDSSIARRTEGTGLGLTISKRLAQFLNGDLIVESQINVGSKFTLCIPKRITAETRLEDVTHNKIL